MMTKLANAVIITGAGRRMGAAFAHALLMDGYAVVSSYRTQTAEVDHLRAAGAIMIAADLATESGAVVFVQAVKQHCLSVRALIHNASVWHTDGEMNADCALRDASFALHVYTPHYLNEALTELLLAAEGLSDIVHISDANVPFGKVDRALYLASKAGAEAVMRSHAQRLAPKVKVNALAPGLMAFHEGDDAAYKQSRLSRSLLGIEPGFETAVNALRYLLASNYTTGSILTLDGGRKD
jgi:dihydromonapterin reductase/dihydrofolate reductase